MILGNMAAWFKEIVEVLGIDEVRRQMTWTTQKGEDNDSI